MDDPYHSTDHSNKRIRLSSPSDAAKNSEIFGQHTQIDSNHVDEQINIQAQKETNVGITEYVAGDVVGFSGIFKKR